MARSPHAPKPKHLNPDYGAQWQDSGMARAYRHRPPYGDATFDMLVALVLEDRDAAVLDVGCGTGDLARPLAERFERVDAVDASEAMVAAGKACSGGKAPGLHWIVAPMETAPLTGPYDLAVAGESIHWMNWERVFPRIAEALAPEAMLAIIERREAAQPWADELGRLIRRYSTNQDYAPFDIVAGLEERGHFELVGTHTTKLQTFKQPREEFIEAIHSRNGFSRARMGVNAPVFDAAFRDLLMRHGLFDDVELEISTVIRWGRPRS